MTAPRVLFYVQYLEGIGHMVRAKRIVEALVRRGCTVSMVVGGVPIPGFSAEGADLRQLSPALRASPSSYSRLLHADGSPIDDADKTARRGQLRGIFQELRPDVIITEAYPMGRWAMHFELESLLADAAARSDRPLILASLRDILQMPKVAEKYERSIAMFEQYYDYMLVHGDSRLARIEESFPPLSHLLGQVRYTGLVVPQSVAAPKQAGLDDEAAFDVIVSGGGGAIGYAVLAAAIAAKPLSSLAEGRWLALAGPRMPDDEFVRLGGMAKRSGVVLERYRDGLVGLMAQAAVSVQRAGYNTVADLLQSGCRAVLVPDSADRQMEQPLRAAKLAELGRACVVPEGDLTPAAMAAAIDKAVELQPAALSIDCNGAEASADIVYELWAQKQAS